MKHHPVATAHAVGLTTAIVFVVCRLLVGVSPNLMFAIGQSWFHGIQLTPMDTWSIPTSTFVLGLVSSSLFGWLIGYLFAVVYNGCIGKRR